MQFFKNLVEQFKKFWSETAPSARIGIIATGVFSLVLIISVGYWSSLPNYVLLKDNLAPEVYVKIIDELSAKGIRYKTSPGGSSISVEQSKLPVARSIAQQFATTEDPFTESTFAGMPSPDIRKAQLLREKELRLAASISKINGIRSATVHLTIARQRLLANRNQQSKASVMLDLKPNYSPSQEVIETIAALVSYVDGLEPEKVAISDMNGRKYTVNDPINRLFDDKLAYKSNLEQDRKNKVEHILNSLVGFGKYSVTVTADVDVKKLDRQTKTYSGDGNETVSKSVTMKNDRPDRYSNGVSGVAANQGTLPKPGELNRSISDGEWKDIVKVYDEVTQKEIDVVNSIKQLSVAAFVELPESEDGTPNPVTLEQLESLIKNAVGFVEGRDDVKVQIGTLAANPLMDGLLAPEQIASESSTEWMLEIIRNSSLALGTLFALIIGFLMLKKMKPVTITEPEPQITPQRSRHLADLTMVARENPEFLSRVIRSWMNDDPIDDADSESDDPPNNQQVAA